MKPFDTVNFNMGYLWDFASCTIPLRKLGPLYLSEFLIYPGIPDVPKYMDISYLRSVRLQHLSRAHSVNIVRRRYQQSYALVFQHAYLSPQTLIRPRFGVTQPPSTMTSSTQLAYPRSFRSSHGSSKTFKTMNNSHMEL